MPDGPFVIVSKISPRGVVQIQGGVLLQAARQWKIRTSEVGSESRFRSVMLRSLRQGPQKKFQKKHREKEKNIRNGHWIFAPASPRSSWSGMSSLRLRPGNVIRTWSLDERGTIAVAGIEVLIIVFGNGVFDFGRDFAPNQTKQHAFIIGPHEVSRSILCNLGNFLI